MVDWNEKVKDALDRTEFMAISTTDEKGSWTNPVQFGYDEHANLYFISMMDATHVANILANGKISGAIYKMERFGGRDVLGLQFSGTAALLSHQNDIQEAARYFYGRDPRKLDPEKRAAELIKAGLWHFFKVTIQELWCFDSRVFGEKRREVDLKSLHIRLES